jgi:hypothetical protein
VVWVRGKGLRTDFLDSVLKIITMESLILAQDER